MTRSLRVALISLAAFAVLAPATQAAPLAGLSVAIDGPTVIPDLDTAHSAGVNFVRLAVDWSQLEPSRPGRYDPTYLAEMDSDIQQATQRGLKVMLTVVTTPCWASSAPANLLATCTPGTTPPAVSAYPPSDPRTFASVAAFLAARYATVLAGFEVWNEPDQINQLYLAGPDKPAHYAGILRAAYPAIKAVAPQVPVLGGAVVGGNGRFLQQLYKAGIKGYYDALSLHFYGAPLYSLKTTRAVQRANGDTKPVWLAEFGWTSCAPRQKTEGQHTCVTPQVQARNLVDVFSALRTTSWVKAVLVYEASDDPIYQFGLTTATQQPKPALKALRQTLAHPGRPRAMKLSMRRSNQRVGGRVISRASVSGSGPGGDVWTLSIYHGNTLRYRSIFALDANDRFRIRLPLAIGPTHGLRATIHSSWSPQTVITARLR